MFSSYSKKEMTTRHYLPNIIKSVTYRALIFVTFTDTKTLITLIA